MPLTEKGEKILGAMEKEYGSEKGKSVFYASKNAGKITGIDSSEGEFITISPRESEFLTIPIHDSESDHPAIHESESGNTPETEYDVAFHMRHGEMSSPQKFQNILLYDLRITGTGTSFRPANNEIVYRPPANFLTEDFVLRCNGLPVIFEHPKGTALDTEEYRDRAIGSIILPYIKGDEVWGIARIYDMDAAELMSTTHSSTSPAVVFRPEDGNEEVDLGDGSHLLIEGIPSYLDHLAICVEGVWDKGNGPTGINNGDNDMPDKEKELKEEEKVTRKDEEVPTWADALSKKLDSLCTRMDKYDSRKDGKEEEEEENEELKKLEEIQRKEKEEEDKKDKKDRKDRKDESEKEKGKKEEHEAGKELEKGREEEKKEDARMDSLRKENAELRNRVATAEGKINSIVKPQSMEDKNAISAAQSRADSLASALGEEVLTPIFGESPISFRKRLASKFQKYSKADAIKKIKLDSLPEDVFPVIEEQIYADSLAASQDPNIAPATAGGGLYYETKKMLGRDVLFPRGDSAVFAARHTAPGYRMVGGFKTDFSKK